MFGPLIFRNSQIAHDSSLGLRGVPCVPYRVLAQQALQPAFLGKCGPSETAARHSVFLSNSRLYILCVRTHHAASLVLFGMLRKTAAFLPAFAQYSLRKRPAFGSVPRILPRVPRVHGVAKVALLPGQPKAEPSLQLTPVIMPGAVPAS